MVMHRIAILGAVGLLIGAQIASAEEVVVNHEASVVDSQIDDGITGTEYVGTTRRRIDNDDEPREVRYVSNVHYVNSYVDSYPRYRYPRNSTVVLGFSVGYPLVYRYSDYYIDTHRAHYRYRDYHYDHYDRHDHHDRRDRHDRHDRDDHRGSRGRWH